MCVRVCVCTYVGVCVYLVVHRSRVSRQPVITSAVIQPSFKVVGGVPRLHRLPLEFILNINVLFKEN